MYAVSENEFDNADHVWQDWANPAGYHVTVPCSKDQTGYKTFDAAFAIDRGNDIIQMKYMHTALRDQDTYHSRLVFVFVCEFTCSNVSLFAVNIFDALAAATLQNRLNAVIQLRQKHLHHATQLDENGTSRSCCPDLFHVTITTWSLLIQPAYDWPHVFDRHHVRCKSDNHAHDALSVPCYVGHNFLVELPLAHEPQKEFNPVHLIKPFEPTSVVTSKDVEELLNVSLKQLVSKEREVHN